MTQFKHTKETNPLHLGAGDLANADRREWLVRAGTMGFLAALGLQSQQASAKALQLGKQAPALVLHTLDGKTISTSDLIGQVVIVAFWATWCEPCCEELPVLSAYAKQKAEAGVKVLGFSIDTVEELPKVREMAHDLSFPVGLLGSAYAGEYGRIWKLPVSFVIDRQGLLAHNGWNDTSQTGMTESKLKAIVDPLVNTTKIHS